MTYPNADDMKWMKWYATTEDVRADDWEWDKWLAEYTRQQREEAFDEGVNAGWIGTNRTLSHVLGDNPYRSEA